MLTSVIGIVEIIDIFNPYKNNYGKASWQTI